MLSNWRRLPIVVCIFGLQIFCSGIQAQTFTIDDCIAAALKSSLPIAALAAKIEASNWAIRKDQGGSWPALTLSDEASYSRFGPDAAFANGSENKANAEFAIDTQRWFTQPQLSSHLELERNQILLSQTQIRLKRDVIQAYDKLAVLIRKADEQRKAAAYVDSHIQDIERMQASGLDIALDLLRAKSQRKSLDFTSNARDAEQKNTLALLQSLTHSAIQAEDLKTAEILNLPIPALPLEAPPVQFDRLNTTLDAKLAALDLETARLATRGQSRFAAPSIRLGLDHSFHAIDVNTPENRAYGAVSFDAFDWGQRGHEALQRVAELTSQVSNNLEQTRLLNLYTTQLSVEIQHARQAYAISSGIVQDTQQGMDIAKTYYRQGKIKETDLLNVLSDYLAAADQRDEALLSTLAKQADWNALWEGEKP